MRLSRILALFLICIGLSTQSAAYAAAPPPAAEDQAIPHCAEMTPARNAPARHQEAPCCGDMQAGCLMTMNCFAPLLPPADGDAGEATVGDAAGFPAMACATLAGATAGPEPPPPQV